MTHRTDKVWLANDVARCEPSTKVAGCSTCGRYLAPIPRMGIVADFSLSISLVAPWCASMLSADQKPAKDQTREVKPWPTGYGWPEQC